MIRVFVVDDHPVLRSGLEAVLRAEPGFSCVGTAADGDGLERAVGRARPTVVVLDRHLAGEDGLDLCRALRARPAAPAVVLYTADDAVSVGPDALEAGAHAVVEKAAGVEELFDAIRLAARATP
jgi:DNA-binding NarL/FixJ family response regulator